MAKKPDQNLIVALDVGTSKIAALSRANRGRWPN